VVDERERLRAPARAAVFAAHRRAERDEWIQATGTSMSPSVRPGTWMHVRFGAAPVRGAIVVVAVGDGYVAHRVVARRDAEGGPLLVTKGDGEAYCDPAVPVADVVGVVRALAARRGGPGSTAGCDGWPATAIARLSHLSGRAAGRARRRALRLRGRAGGALLRASEVAARAVTQMSAALLVRAARSTADSEGR
jgi:hypothetical protein